MDDPPIKEFLGLRPLNIICLHVDAALSAFNTIRSILLHVIDVMRRLLRPLDFSSAMLADDEKVGTVPLDLLLGN